MRILPIDPLDRVTGSCYLVHVPERDVRLLVDCGTYQDGLNAEALDERDFTFDPAKLTAVILTHAHIDHCGRIPRLVLAGFDGQVIATDETIAIAKIVLEDAARLNNRADEVSALQRIRWRSYDSDLFVRPLSVATDVFVRAYRSAHIFGAVSVEIIAGPKERPEEQTHVLFSGDIGNNRDGREVQPLLRHVMDPVGPVHIAVMESTYGATRRDAVAFDPAARRQRLGAVIRAGIERGGPVIIPVFGVQRAQDVLWDLHILLAQDPSMLGNAPILYDAPMGLQMHAVVRAAAARNVVSPSNKVRPAWLGRHVFTELGLDPNSPDDLAAARASIDALFGDRPAWSVGQCVPDSPLAESVVDRMRPRWWRVNSYERDAVAREQRSSVVLATGGMADGGPVQTWLREWLRDPRATVAFSGYCARGSLGAELSKLASVDPVERRRMQERLSLPDSDVRGCDVAAQIHVMSGYSAHADQSRLVDWAFPRRKNGKAFAVAPRVLVTHGDASARRALREALLDHAASNGMQLHVDLPRPDGPGIDVRTGAPIARELILGTATEATVLDLSIAEAVRELEALRVENTRLRAELSRLRTGSTAKTNPASSPDPT